VPGATAHSRPPAAAAPQVGPRAGADTGHLAEVWGDVVDLRHLGAAVVIGGVISLGTFLIFTRIFAATVAVPDVARAYAMLVGLLACVASGAICARLFAPKREVIETETDDNWRANVMDQLASETGTIGDISELPPTVVREMKELGLYDLFATYDQDKKNKIAAAAAAGQGAPDTARQGG